MQKRVKLIKVESSDYLNESMSLNVEINPEAWSQNFQ